MLISLSDLNTSSCSNFARIAIREDLTEFPQALYALADTLRVLDLSGNQLHSLPDDFHRLHNLRVVFLSENNFTEVPEVLAKCSNLEMIGFKSNDISCVPEHALPESTRWLILTDNCLEKLPDSMGDLTRLQKCMLAGNRLSALPESMRNCKNLELLRVSANKLISWPKFLSELPKLRWLAIAGNDLATDMTKPQPNHSAEEPVIPAITLAQLTLENELGRGASGVIYKARWQDRDVAVKIFKGSVTSDGYPADELRASLLTVGVPNVIRVIAELVDNDTHGLVMELIPPEFYNLGLPPSMATCTRDTFADDFALDASMVVRIARAIAQALADLHARGVLHGDLYAHNILVNDTGDVLLGDFGAATRYQDAGCRAGDDRFLIVEARAYACLLDDLLSVTESSEPTLHFVRELRDRIFAEPLHHGLDFESIVRVLGD